MKNAQNFTPEINIMSSNSPKPKHIHLTIKTRLSVCSHPSRSVRLSEAQWGFRLNANNEKLICLH